MQAINFRMIRIGYPQVYCLTSLLVFSCGKVFLEGTHHYILYAALRIQELLDILNIYN